MKGYLLMMNNLKKYVNKDGLWNQLIDQPDFGLKHPDRQCLLMP